MIWIQLVSAVLDGVLLCTFLYLATRNQENYRFRPLPIVSAVVAGLLFLVTFKGRAWASPYLLYSVAPLAVFPIAVLLIVRGCRMSRLKAVILMVVFYLTYLPLNAGRELLFGQVMQNWLIRRELIQRTQARESAAVREAPTAAPRERTAADFWILELRAWPGTRLVWHELLQDLHPILLSPMSDLRITRVEGRGQMTMAENQLIRGGTLILEAMTKGPPSHAARLKGYVESAAPFRDLFENVGVVMDPESATLAPGVGESVFRVTATRRIQWSPAEDPIHDSLSQALQHASPFVLNPDETGDYRAGAEAWVRSHAEAAGVRIQDLRPYAISDGPGAIGRAHMVRAYTLKVTGRASFQQAIRMLCRMEVANPFVCVFNLLIESDPAAPEEHRFQMDVQWPVWANRDAVVRILKAEGMDPVPEAPTTEWPAMKTESLRDPFWPADYVPKSGLVAGASSSTPGLSEEQWLAAENRLNVAGNGLGADGTPYAIVNGAVVATGDTVRVRSGKFEFVWVVGGIDRIKGVQFARREAIPEDRKKP